MFDFLDEFDLEDFVVGANLIEEFEQEEKEYQNIFYEEMFGNDENETDCEFDDDF